MANGYKTRLGAPALNTLVHRIAVLSKAHQLAKAPNPCADPLVRELLAQTRRAYAKRGARPRKQRALTKDPLQAVLATCDDTLRGKRDRALLLFAWATGGRRRSEVASATLENLQRVDAQAPTSTRSRTPRPTRPAPSAPRTSSPWWAARRRPCRRGSPPAASRKAPSSAASARAGHLGEPLAPAAVRDIVKERCALAGVEGKFSAHSLRAGFVTEAGRQNMSLPETMAMTGHHSVATVMGYFRAESALGSKVSRMLDEE